MRGNPKPEAAELRQDPLQCMVDAVDLKCTPLRAANEDQTASGLGELREKVHGPSRNDNTRKEWAVRRADLAISVYSPDDLNAAVGGVHSLLLKSPSFARPQTRGIEQGTQNSDRECPAPVTAEGINVLRKECGRSSSSLRIARSPFRGIGGAISRGRMR